MQSQTTASWQSFEKERGRENAAESVRMQTQWSLGMDLAGGNVGASVQVSAFDLQGAMRDPFGTCKEYFRGNDYY